MRRYCRKPRTKKGRREREFPGGLQAGSFLIFQRIANLPRCLPPLPHARITTGRSSGNEFVPCWLSSLRNWQVTLLLSPFVPSFIHPCAGVVFRWKSVLQGLYQSRIAGPKNRFRSCLEWRLSLASRLQVIHGQEVSEAAVGREKSERQIRRPAAGKLYRRLVCQNYNAALNFLPLASVLACRF